MRWFKEYVWLSSLRNGLLMYGFDLLFGFLESRIGDLARREDVVGVEAVLLQPRIGELDEREPAPRSLLQRDPDRVVAHETELLEER